MTVNSLGPGRLNRIRINLFAFFGLFYAVLLIVFLLFLLIFRPQSAPASRLPRTSRATTLADVERMNKLKADLGRLRGENVNLKEKLKQRIEEPKKVTLSGLQFVSNL